jgi:hypothetical protein
MCLATKILHSAHKVYQSVSHSSQSKEQLFPKQLIFVMAMGCIFFEVWTECLNIISMSFGFKGLT